MSTELVRAKADAAASRARLVDTAHELQTRLKPAVIAGNAVESAKRKSEEIAEDAVEAVKRRPVAASAAAAGVAAMLGFALFTRLRRHTEDDGEE